METTKLFNGAKKFGHNLHHVWLKLESISRVSRRYFSRSDTSTNYNDIYVEKSYNPRELYSWYICDNITDIHVKNPN